MKIDVVFVVVGWWSELMKICGILFHFHFHYENNKGFNRKSVSGVNKVYWKIKLN